MLTSLFRGLVVSLRFNPGARRTTFRSRRLNHKHVHVWVTALWLSGAKSGGVNTHTHLHPTPGSTLTLIPNLLSPHFSSSCSSHINQKRLRRLKLDDNQHMSRPGPDTAVTEAANARVSPHWLVRRFLEGKFFLPGTTVSPYLDVRVLKLKDVLTCTAVKLWLETSGLKLWY